MSQEGNVPHCVSAVQGAARQADGHAAQHQPQLCALYHPESREARWQDRRAACTGPAPLQRSAGGHPNLSPGLPQQDPVPGQSNINIQLCN